MVSQDDGMERLERLAVMSPTCYKFYCDDNQPSNYI